MNAFGGMREEPMMTDMVDDEYDVLNDETFGVEVPNEEWEGDHNSSQYESEKPEALDHSSLLDFAASKLPVNDDPLDFLLEQSINHLMEDDDDVVVIRKRSGATAEPIADIFAPGSAQNPFFQLDKANIWSDSPSSIVKSKPSSAQALSGLIEKMRINGNNNAGPIGPPGGPLLVKGTKTAEELEAEMLGKPTPHSTGPQRNDVVGSAPPPSSLPPPPPGMKSCQELERELIEGSRAATAPTGPPLPPPGGIPALPQGANLVGHPPPPPHLLLANPQVRAVLMARWLAANPGVVPPIWLRMPPPPIMPPPRPGFPHPPMMRPGPPNMPPNMNFPHPNMRMAQGLVPRGVGVTIQQGGMQRRSSPNFPKRRLFDSPGRSQRNEDGYADDPRRRDPFAGLMTRRERSWLMKIQSLQLHSDNPYVDDYYWMMYRRRKMTGNGDFPSTDAGHNDNIEHRVYVPPSFEGSLGKVQVLSANFPRQLLDLAAASTTNGERNSVDDGSPTESPTPKLSTASQPVTNTRRLKHILIELENLYIMLLEANDLAIMQTDGVQSKERATVRIKHLIECIVSTLTTDNHIVSAMSIRKGRRLLLQLMPYCERDQRVQLAESVMKNLLLLSKKELSNDILSMLKLIFSSTKLAGLSEREWSQLWQATNADIVETAMKSKMGILVMVEIVQFAAADNAILDASATKPIERWASIMYTNITGTGSNSSNMGAQQQAASSTDRVDSMCEWLNKLAGTPIPPSVVETIRTYLAVGEQKKP